METGIIVSEIEEVTLIGTGNVGSHIASYLSDKGVNLKIFSKNFVNAEYLAKDLKNAVAVKKLSHVKGKPSIIIISVKDDAISDVASVLAELIDREDTLVVHTSGSCPIEVLNNLNCERGVLYPLQTFTKGIPVDFSKIHFFYEGNNERVNNRVANLAALFSDKIHFADSKTRNKLHIAAVFACNFVNNMWAIADDILNDVDLDFSVMKPLVYATFEKALSVSPVNGQTGPAVRRDFSTIERHLEQLPPDLKSIYSLITQSIIEYDTKHKST